MIYGENKNTQEAVLASLKESRGYEFYLTGSHYFGGATKSSDRDYFVEDTVGIFGFLTQLGFEIKSENAYTDKHVKSVLRHYTAKIDVQIVNSASEKLRVQQKIKDQCTFYNKLSKSDRVSLWNMLLP